MCSYQLKIREVLSVVGVRVRQGMPDVNLRSVIIGSIFDTGWELVRSQLNVTYL
jgi:hypothetical protein